MTRIFIETLQKFIKEDSIQWTIIKKTDLDTFKETKITEYESKLNKLTLKTNQKARIHKCYHENKPNQACKILKQR